MGSLDKQSISIKQAEQIGNPDALFHPFKKAASVLTWSNEVPRTPEKKQKVLEAFIQSKGLTKYAKQFKAAEKAVYGINPKTNKSIMETLFNKQLKGGNEADIAWDMFTKLPAKIENAANAYSAYANNAIDSKKDRVSQLNPTEFKQASDILDNFVDESLIDYNPLKVQSNIADIEKRRR